MKCATEQSLFSFRHLSYLTCRLLWCISSPAVSLCPWELLAAYCLCDRCTSWGKEDGSKTRHLARDKQIKKQVNRVLFFLNAVIQTLKYIIIQKRNGYSCPSRPFLLCFYLILPFIQLKRNSKSTHFCSFFTVYLWKILVNISYLRNSHCDSESQAKTLLFVVFNAALASKCNGWQRSSYFFFFFSYIKHYRTLPWPRGTMHKQL